MTITRRLCVGAGVRRVYLGLTAHLMAVILHSSADKVLHGGFIHAVYDWDIPAAFIALVGAKTGGDVGEI